MKPIHNFFSFLPINGKPSKEPTIVVFVGSYSCKCVPGINSVKNIQPMLWIYLDLVH